MCPSAWDVHRKRSQIAVVDDTGVPNDPVQLVPILGALPPSTPVAFEAAYGWGWLAGLLEELELEPHLVHPSRCKAIASARLKDDRVDARTLALLRHRAALVRVASALKCRVHAILTDRGVTVAEPLWGSAGRIVLAELALP